MARIIKKSLKIRHWLGFWFRHNVFNRIFPSIKTKSVYEYGFWLYWLKSDI